VFISTVETLQHNNASAPDFARDGWFRLPEVQPAANPLGRDNIRIVQYIAGRDTEFDASFKEVLSLLGIAIV